MIFKKLKKSDLEGIDAATADQKRQENKKMRTGISFAVVIILLIILFFASINIGSLKVGFFKLLEGLFVKSKISKNHHFHAGRSGNCSIWSFVPGGS